MTNLIKVKSAAPEAAKRFVDDVVAFADVEFKKDLRDSATHLLGCNGNYDEIKAYLELETASFEQELRDASVPASAIRFFLSALQGYVKDCFVVPYANESYGPGPGLLTPEPPRNFPRGFTD